jgi:hypothetical protein
MVLRIEQALLAEPRQGVPFPQQDRLGVEGVDRACVARLQLVIGTAHQQRP